MLKKTVTYQNLDGQTVTKDLYFNVSANELVEKEALSESKYSERLKAIASTNKMSEIYPVVIEFLKDGYGIRTPEGDFEKDPTGVAWEKFRNSLAYEALMDELLLDPAQNGTNLANFINGMLPPTLVAKGQAENATPGFRPGADTRRPTPPVAGEKESVPPQPVQVGQDGPLVTVEGFESPAPAPVQPDIPGAPVITEPEQGVTHQ